MKSKKLTRLSEFEELKRGQQILVEWTDFFVNHHDSKKVMLYTIYQHRKRTTEIICRKKENHYFNYGMFLGLDTIGKNTSQAIEVYLVEGGE